jgi:shikimate dehydrogenase
VSDRPFVFDVSLPSGVPSHYDHHVVRHLSEMEGYFADRDSYAAMLAREDTVLYEVYEQDRPAVPGELMHGLSVVHPGKVGDEYFMTKGHFHALLESGEVYICLQGTGMMVMETPEGDWSVEVLQPGRVLYVPPRWAHRSVNTGADRDLVTFYVYPATAGHDYGSIEGRGFRKLVLERDGQPQVVDNPQWITRTFYFIGVTTGQSSIMRVFPLWMKALGRPDVAIAGVDLALHDDPGRYRRVVAQIKDDPLALGALVTAHKIDLYDAAHDMFDSLDRYAQLCGEVSCIAKQDGRLEGYAKDPVSAGLSLDAILGEGYFARTGGEVLIFGAGGAAVAIALHLISKDSSQDRPRRFVVVNRSPGRLDRLRDMVGGLGTDVAFEYVCNADPRRNDEIMGRMPEGSVVINATGMGKDRPGSPVTGAGLFPVRGVAWELNYRGQLDFMHQALAQRASRNVRVEDGWSYFLYGWTQAIAQVLHLTIDRALFDRLSAVAAEVR